VRLERCSQRISLVCELSTAAITRAKATVLTPRSYIAVALHAASKQLLFVAHGAEAFSLINVGRPSQKGVSRDYQKAARLATLMVLRSMHSESSVSLLIIPACLMSHQPSYPREPSCVD
jgi:hypothetical protein